MYIEQIYTKCLAEASYYVESNGEALIIDPIREVQSYINMANERGAKIKYIFETHFHADFVSGHIDLAKKTGATIVYGPTAKTGYETYEAKDGEVFNLGEITLEVLHTPGHTPESSTFLLKDKDGKDHCVFTGDTLFIGDVGRPDLAVKGNLTREDLAGMMYDSLRNKIMPLADEVIVYPGHGAGSSCGKNLSTETVSSIGEQKATNYALQNISKEEFIKELTTGILPPPQYFPQAAMKNKNGYEAIDDVLSSGNKALTIDEVLEKQKNGALILDVRNKYEFPKGFIPNSWFIGLDGSFAMWVGAMISDMNQKIIVLTEEGREEEAAIRLARVGYDNCIGYVKGGFEAYKNSGNPIDSFESIVPEEMKKRIPLDNTKVLDVRKPGEFSAEHVEDAITCPLDYMTSSDSLEKLDKNTNYLVHCKSGFRSLIAASILKSKGFNNVVDIDGGIQAILESDIKTTDFVCPSTL